VPYFSVAAVRAKGDGWSAAEVNLTGAADIEEVADRLREVDPDATTSVLFVEADDEYLVIVRLDGGEDLRVFGSDAAFAEEARLGSVLLGEIEEPALEIAEVTEVVLAVSPAAAADEAVTAEPADPDTDPVGDADLLADLGLSAHQLLQLCAHDGLLPADVTAEICQIIGCGDVVEELREP
jgi:putative tRNA adenosine deaminase-associated protein